MYKTGRDQERNIIQEATGRKRRQAMISIIIIFYRYRTSFEGLGLLSTHPWYGTVRLWNILELESLSYLLSRSLLLLLQFIE